MIVQPGGFTGADGVRGLACRPRDKCLTAYLFSCFNHLFIYLQVQEMLLDYPWDHTTLQLPGCHEVQDSDGQKIMAGPPIRMGIFKGNPLRIEPHK